MMVRSRPARLVGAFGAGDVVHADVVAQVRAGGLVAGKGGPVRGSSSAVTARPAQQQYGKASERTGFLNERVASCR